MSSISEKPSPVKCNLLERYCGGEAAAQRERERMDRAERARLRAAIAEGNRRDLPANDPTTARPTAAELDVNQIITRIVRAEVAKVEAKLLYSIDAKIDAKMNAIRRDLESEIPSAVVEAVESLVEDRL